MSEIKLPELGEGISSVEISDILINTGDTIKIDDPMIVVETEKASMEIPSTSSGIVNKIHINKGDSISPGDKIISISSDDVKISESESTIEDENAEQPLDETINTGLSDSTREILSSLTPREAKVLRMRFGIDMNTDHTLEEVGKQFDVTRERIRQIEAKALRKLRHPSRAHNLKSFLDND